MEPERRRIKRAAVSEETRSGRKRAALKPHTRTRGADGIDPMAQDVEVEGETTRETVERKRPASRIHRRDTTGRGEAF